MTTTQTRKTYTHPECGSPCTEPALLARSGQSVTLLRELGDDERDVEVGRMFHVAFPDGYEADAFQHELSKEQR